MSRLYGCNAMKESRAGLYRTKRYHACRKGQYKTAPYRREQYKAVPRRREQYKTAPRRRERYKTVPRRKEQHKTAPRRKERYKTVPCRKERYKTVVPCRREHRGIVLHSRKSHKDGLCEVVPYENRNSSDKRTVRKAVLCDFGYTSLTFGGIDLKDR